MENCKLTDLFSVYLAYLAALTLKRCGITPHSKEIAQYFERTLIDKHLTTREKADEFEKEGWSLIETFTLVDQHRLDPFLKGILTIVEIQNLLEQTNGQEQLITVTRQCALPYSQSWSLSLKPNINLFTSEPFIVDLKLKIDLSSVDSQIQITSIETDDLDHQIFIEKMEIYKQFHSRS